MYLYMFIYVCVYYICVCVCVCVCHYIGVCSNADIGLSELEGRLVDCQGTGGLSGYWYPP